MSNEKPALTKSKVSSEKISVSKSKFPNSSKTKSFQKSIVTERQKDTSFHQPMSVIDKFPINQKVAHIRTFDNIRKYEKSHQVVNDQKLNNVRKSMNSQQISNKTFKSKVTLTPQKPNFPNSSITKPTKVSCSNEKSEIHSINNWLEGQGKRYQSERFSQV